MAAALPYIAMALSAAAEITKGQSEASQAEGEAAIAKSNADTVIEEDMLLVIELYAGEVGGDHGVKLGDQVQVTADGLRVLAPYPFLDR